MAAYYYTCSLPAAKYAVVVKLPALTVYLPLPALRHLGKGGLFVAPPLEDFLTGLTGSSTRAGTGCKGCTDLQLIGSSVADCQVLT